VGSEEKHKGGAEWTDQERGEDRLSGGERGDTDEGEGNKQSGIESMQLRVTNFTFRSRLLGMLYVDTKHKWGLA
jgi:hypothetical protein